MERGAISVLWFKLLYYQYYITINHYYGMFVSWSLFQGRKQNKWIENVIELLPPALKLHWNLLSYMYSYICRIILQCSKEKTPFKTFFHSKPPNLTFSRSGIKSPKWAVHLTFDCLFLENLTKHLQAGGYGRCGNPF